ncbi:MAG TPA: CBS domain-containing protein [Pirellulales bacterium]|nr:CBS domain-containing protein [Pirellulales bacterium]
MSVGRICNRLVVLAGPKETIVVAARRMLEQRVGTLLVLNDSKQPIGILTDRDLVTRVMAVGKDPNTVHVDEVMTSDLRTVSEDTPIETAIAEMDAGGFRRMPVIGAREALVGMISLDDILGLLVEEFASIGGILDSTRVTR